ncbi:isopenicillin N synthase family oxygenase [Methylocapsa sp. S129]|uniref:isopenicillin N synthase family dioxygenase n=1 Tax=Methylocapsa sp. S129 TaxID=1641869 RepID=UPI001FEF4633|nr:2-oxoglutarate and iron-dependent oxygenase domain-containing protein [Methylocapsa sp. S129]
MIDVSSLAADGSQEARAKTVAALRNALERSGFAYLSGHGIAQDMIDRLRGLSQAFHALPMEAKQRIVMNEYHRGYMPFSSSTIVTSTVAKVTRPNQSESLMIMQEVSPDDPAYGEPLRGPNQWPEELPEFRGVALDYMEKMTGLGMRMAGGLAEALNLPRDWFLPFFQKPTLFLRLLHYPRQPDEAGLFGSAPHTDYGFITILGQDEVGGLEVRNRHNEWIAAPPLAGTFVMNVGDILQRWSNGLFASTPHRVRNLKPVARYSMPFFFDPSMDATVACPPQILEGGQEPSHAPVVYGDYLLERLNKNYDYRKKAS